MIIAAWQHPLKGWFLSFLVLGIVDLVSTAIILQLGLVKGNAIGMFFVQHGGFLVPVGLKAVLMSLVWAGVGRIAKRSPEAQDLACNVLIVLSGLVLMMFTVSVAQCILAYT